MVNSKVAGVLTLALLAACGSTTSASPTLTTASAGLVRVEVRLVQVGGAMPAPGLPSPQPRPIVGGQVQAVYDGLPASQPVTMTTGARGLARFYLRPGRYRFDGRESAAGRFYCQTFGQPVQVVSRRHGPPLLVTVTCAVP